MKRRGKKNTTKVTNQLRRTLILSRKETQKEVNFVILVHLVFLATLTKDGEFTTSS